MPETIDLNQVVYFLETARTQVKNIFSKHGTNGKDSIQQNLEEALKELRKVVPAQPTLESVVPAA